MGRLGDRIGRAFTSPLRALIPKNPWIRIALVVVPILLVLALLEPVLSLFEKGMDVGVRLLEPLLDSPTGRLLLLNLILLVACVVGFFVLRARVRSFRSGLLLRRHLDAVEALAGDRDRQAAEGFRRVAKASLSVQRPVEYPAVVEDAKIKLARLALEAGDADRALEQVTRVRERDLPKELARSHAQLRALALVEQDRIDPVTIRTEVDAALKRFKDDTVLLDLARELALEAGEFGRAADYQERILDHAPDPGRDAMRTRLLEDTLRAGDHELEAGELDAAQARAKKANRLEPDAAASGAGILSGRIALARGKPKVAVREWGKTRSPAALREVSRLLEQQPDAVSPRELLEACPMQGTLLLVAREYARRGDHARAERAARVAARSLGLTPSVASVLAEVLEHAGRSDEAQEITETAVHRLLADPGADVGECREA